MLRNKNGEFGLALLTLKVSASRKKIKNTRDFIFVHINHTRGPNDMLSTL